MTAGAWRERQILWSRTKDAEFPYEAAVDRQRWVVRINDFPVDPTKYTLLVDGVERSSFNAWPADWVRP